MASDLKIYNIAQAVTDAFNAVSIDEETGEVIGQDALDAVITQSQEKVLDCARYLRVRSFDLKAMEEIKKDLDARIKAEKRRQAWLNDRILDAMEFFQVQSVEAPDLLIKTAKTPEAVEIFDPEMIPVEYIKTKTDFVIDKAAIKAAIKAGRIVAGATLSSGTRLVLK